MATSFNNNGSYFFPLLVIFFSSCYLQHVLFVQSAADPACAKMVTVPRHHGPSSRVMTVTVTMASTLLTVTHLTPRRRRRQWDPGIPKRSKNGRSKRLVGWWPPLPSRSQPRVASAISSTTMLDRSSPPVLLRPAVPNVSAYNPQPPTDRDPFLPWSMTRAVVSRPSVFHASIPSRFHSSHPALSRLSVFHYRHPVLSRPTVPNI